MPATNRRTTGELGETLAARALAQRGYEIVARNWRCASGEIDLVARDGDCWVFVEVKTRRSLRAGPPEGGLTDDKAKRLLVLAEIYLAEHGLAEVTWRLDLVAIELGRDDTVRRLEVIPAVGVW